MVDASAGQDCQLQRTRVRGRGACLWQGDAGEQAIALPLAGGLLAKAAAHLFDPVALIRQIHLAVHHFELRHASGVPVATQRSRRGFQPCGRRTLRRLDWDLHRRMCVEDRRLGIYHGAGLVLARPVECLGLHRRSLGHHRVASLPQVLQLQLPQVVPGVAAFAFFERISRDEGHREYDPVFNTKVGECVDHGGFHLRGLQHHRHHADARHFSPKVQGDLGPCVLPRLRARRLLAVELYHHRLCWPPLRWPVHVRGG
mmetsp:Transcript_11049/g.31484  ORF Transcript_11049/g.31484 Transcript_11049/m.31484 type:complete len:257 (-) Transcript_11049:1717-2487(-)